jgi:hypothetical protein
MSTCWDCKHLDKRTGGFQYCLLLGRRNVDANKDRCDEFDLETMTTPPLSPAQKVRKAATDAYWLFHPDQAAALLIAAADQVARMDPLGDDIEDLFRGAEREHMRGRFHALAAELRQEGRA